MTEPSATHVRPGADRTSGSPDPDGQGQAQEPFLRFYHSVPLREKTLAVLDALEHSTDPTKHRAALSGIVVELTRCGMDAYFMKPLKDAEAGFIVEQTASFGMTGAVQLLSSVISSIIGRMGTPQLLSVSSSIRQFMQ
jgi:hypothetical protein